MSIKFEFPEWHAEVGGPQAPVPAAAARKEHWLSDLEDLSGDEDDEMSAEQPDTLHDGDDGGEPAHATSLALQQPEEDVVWQLLFHSTTPSCVSERHGYPVHAIPSEVMVQVLSLLDVKDCCSVACVCRHWHDTVLRSHDLWQPHGPLQARQAQGQLPGPSSRRPGRSLTLPPGLHSCPWLAARSTAVGTRILSRLSCGLPFQFLLDAFNAQWDCVADALQAGAPNTAAAAAATAAPVTATATATAPAAAPATATATATATARAAAPATATATATAPAAAPATALAAGIATATAAAAATAAATATAAAATAADGGAAGAGASAVAACGAGAGSAGSAGAGAGSAGAGSAGASWTAIGAGPTGPAMDTPATPAVEAAGTTGAAAGRVATCGAAGCPADTAAVQAAASAAAPPAAAAATAPVVGAAQGRPKPASAAPGCWGEAGEASTDASRAGTLVGRSRECTAAAGSSAAAAATAAAAAAADAAAAAHAAAAATATAAAAADAAAAAHAAAAAAPLSATGGGSRGGLASGSEVEVHDASRMERLSSCAGPDVQVDERYDARKVARIIRIVVNEKSMAWMTLYEGVAAIFNMRASQIAWELEQLLAGLSATAQQSTAQQSRSQGTGEEAATASAWEQGTAFSTAHAEVEKWLAVEDVWRGAATYLAAEPSVLMAAMGMEVQPLEWELMENQPTGSGTAGARAEPKPYLPTFSPTPRLLVHAGGQ